MAFHFEGVGRGKTVAQNRSEKECRVREGRAHAALVFDGETCVGWCQFGSPDELPRIKHRRAYLEGEPAVTHRSTQIVGNTHQTARGAVFIGHVLAPITVYCARCVRAGIRI